MKLWAICAAQVAVTQRKAGEVARDDRRKLESVSANGLILYQDDPSAPTCLAQPLGVRRIVRKVRRVSFDAESSSAQLDRDLSTEGAVDEPSEQFRRLHSSRTGLRPRSSQRRDGSPARVRLSTLQRDSAQ